MPPSTEHPPGAGRDGDQDGPSQAEIDRRFAELMGDPDLDDLRSPAPNPATEPAEPEDPEDPEDAGEPTAEAAPTLGGPRDYAPPEEPDEPFEPPEPESLENADPIRLVAWTGAIAGPVALLLVVLLWSSAPAIVWLTLLAVTLVGWGVGIARLPRTRDDDDDGAVV